MTRDVKVLIPGGLNLGIKGEEDNYTDCNDTWVKLPIHYAVSDTFKVNVYDPASTVVLPSKSAATEEINALELIIQGGYLINQSEVDYDCNKSFKTGTSTTLNYPKLGSGDEEIIWTVSKPGAVTIDVVDKVDKEGVKLGTPKHLKFNFNMPGKYTVTGTTKYSKMKVKFTVQVDAPTLDEWKAAKESADVEPVMIDAKDATRCVTIGENGISLSKGDSVTLGLVLGTTNLGGNVTYKSSDPTKVMVFNSGVVKLKDNCKDVTITITLDSNAKGATSENKIEKTVKINPTATTP